MQWYEQTVSLGGQLRGAERRAREILFQYSCVGLVVGAVLMVVMVRRELLAAACAVLCSVNVSMILYMSSGHAVHQGAICAYLYASFTALCLADLDLRGTWSGAWVAFVILIDLAMVLRVSRPCAASLLGAISLWVALMSAEETLRFGLFDVRFTSSQSDRMEVWEKMGECGKLPCKGELAPLYGGLLLCVFVVDFVITRGFAREVLSEQDAMVKTISVVQDIATLLSEYDVDRVGEILRDTHPSALPPGMHAALWSIEHNLRQYKRYLPAGLFDQLTHSQDDPVEATGNPLLSSIPPGVPNGSATIVFTDIRASTTIWEKAPEAMRKAIKIHNTLMRAAIESCQGYEVKTIGDAFMVAFGTVGSGLEFGLLAHENLLSADWPSALLDVPICARQKLWGGVTVRVGMNSGPVTIEENSLTKRIDYLGPTVNVAARLEAHCMPGAVCVSESVWDTLCAQNAHHNCTFTDPHVVALRGVSETVDVRHLWPAALSARQYCPLESRVSGSSSSSEHGVFPNEMVPRVPCSELRTSDATMGVVQLNTGKGMRVAERLNSGLEALHIALERCAGTLVTVMGSRVCVGWNLSRVSRSHVDSAIHFIQILKRGIGESLEASSLVTGTVQHGDVGSYRQKFLTVVGSAVQVSWSLCHLSQLEQSVCLFSMLDTQREFPVSLKRLIRLRTAPVTIEGVLSKVYVVKMEEG